MRVNQEPGTRNQIGGVSMEEKKMTKTIPQNLVMENREKLSVTGVLDVTNFNTESVTLDTELGGMVIKGEDLRISKLNLENFEMVIEGKIVSCVYNDEYDSRKGWSFFGKMFK